jgi:hypothetical protein
MFYLRHAETAINLPLSKTIRNIDFKYSELIMQVHLRPLKLQTILFDHRHVEIYKSQTEDIINF